MTDKPYEERVGGSYRRDKGTGKATLVERTEEKASSPAGPSTVVDGSPPAVIDGAKKPSAKRSD